MEELHFPVVLVENRYYAVNTTWDLWNRDAMYGVLRSSYGEGHGVTTLTIGGQTGSLGLRNQVTSDQTLEDLAPTVPTTMLVFS